MAYDYTGMTIFITGAAKGQGRAAAIAFSQAGANIIAFDLADKLNYPAYNNASSLDLDTLVEQITRNGEKIKAYTGDVRNASDVENVISDGVETFGRLDVVFANAGISAYCLSHDLSESEWDTMLDINLKGAWLTAKYAIPYLIKQKKGVIIYNSSIAGLRGLNRLSHYSASKYALVGLAKSQAIELAQYNIRVLTLHPTGVNTPMNDGLAAMEGTTAQEIAERSAGNLLPVPWIEPEDVSNALLFLASDDARYVTGSQFVLDAGLLSR